MSELYLTLRSRLHVVEDWVEIDGALLREARNRIPLSREKLAARLNCSAKTIERWEEDGRVRRYMIPAIAKELGLQIDEPDLEPLIVTVPRAASDTSRVEAVEVRLIDAIEKLVVVLERLEERLTA